MKKIPIVLCAAAVLSSALLAGSALASSANAKEYAPVDDALVVSVTTTAEEQVDDTAPSTAPFSFRMELPDPSKYDGMTDEERQEAMKADLKAALDKKVADGVLTQTQADKILERVDKMPGDRPKAFRGFFGKDNLFGAELDLSKYEGMTDEERQQAIKADLKAALDKKVADGTLTQAQADKFLEHVDKMPGDGVKMFGSFCGKDNLFGTELDLSKYEGMTDEERREAIKADLKAALDKKVADGTLTQAQADKILKRADEIPGDSVKMFGGLFGKDDLFGTELDLSKYEGMTDEERREAIKADLKAALDKKVADGTLTQAQADKMLEHIDKMPGNRPFAGERKHNAPSGTAPGAADTAEDAGTVTRVPAMGSGSILSL